MNDATGSSTHGSTDRPHFGYNELRGWLNVTGVFVGTHGLAVFLVVYYATKLYPDAREERAEWIGQIAEIRQLVDPEKRPLNRSQAIAFTSGLSDLFISSLEEGLKGDLASKEFMLTGRQYGSDEEMQVVAFLLWGSRIENSSTVSTDSIVDSFELALNDESGRLALVLQAAARRRLRVAINATSRVRSVQSNYGDIHDVWCGAMKLAFESVLFKVENVAPADYLTMSRQFAEFVARDHGAFDANSQGAAALGPRKLPENIKTVDALISETRAVFESEIARIVGTQ